MWLKKEIWINVAKLYYSQNQLQRHFTQETLILGGIDIKIVGVSVMVKLLI
jgi:hypothetical protein